MKNYLRRIKQTILSKWGYYFIIAIILVILTVIVFTTATFQDFTTRLTPTFIGIWVNFGFFAVFFDFREYLEWKPVKQIMNKRIAKQLDNFFGTMTVVSGKNALQVKPSDIEVNGKFNREKYSRYQLEVLKGEKVQAIPSPTFIRILRDHRLSIGQLLTGYGQFLDATVQIALIVLEDSLETLTKEMEMDANNREHDPTEIRRAIHKIAERAKSFSKQGEVGMERRSIA